MSSVTQQESLALQSFVAEIQVVIGGPADLASGEMHASLIALSESLPRWLGPVAERVLRGILAEVSFRLETTVHAAQPSTAFAGWLTALMTVPGDKVAQEFKNYCEGARGRSLEGISQSNRKRLADPRVVMALDFLARSYSDPVVSVSDAAQVAGTSKWYLERLLRRETDGCFLYHLHRTRLDAACWLLLHSGNSIKRVAYEVGYTSVTALDRRFKQRFGASPSEWRRCMSRAGT